MDGIRNFIKKRLIYGFLGISLAVFFSFGFFHIAKFISSDEHFWLPNSGTERIEDYWRAIRHGEWSDTRINDKPGVTLAYIPGLVQFFQDATGQVSTSGKAKTFNPERTLEINFIYRVPVLVFSGLFSLFFFWIMRKITDDDWIALWSSILILLSPILLGISQIVNPDSLFWIFSVAAILSFFHFLQTSENKFALLTTVFFGLTMASKYVGIILIPFFLVMMASFYLFEFKSGKNKNDLQKTILKNSLAYLAVIFGGLAIFAILMPALIVKPKFFYEGTIGFPGMAPIFWLVMAVNLLLLIDAYFWKSRWTFFILEKLQPLKKWLSLGTYAILLATFIFILLNWMLRNSLIDLSEIPYDLKRSDVFQQLPLLYRFIMEALPIVFSLVPFVLFSVIYLWIRAFFQEGKHALLTFLLSIFIIIFYIATISQGLLLTIRYSIMLYPMASILAAIGIRHLFTQREKVGNGKTDWPRAIFAFFLAAVAVGQAMSQYFQSLTKTQQDKIYISYHRPIEYLSVAAIIAIVYALYRIIYFISDSKRIRELNNAYITLLLIVLSIIPLWLIKPFYFNYTNDFLPKKYIITAAWGYGGYEAAQFVNQMPNAKNLTVWTDMYGFCEFFVGKCLHSTKIDTRKYKIDYFYLTSKGSLSPRFPHPMESHSAWRMEIDGREKNFLKLVKALPLNEADNLLINANKNDEFNAEN